MARRYYSSTAVETTLSGSISNSATSITVTALSGFPNTTPWTAILDADTASEELVEVTNVAGTTLTVTRGVDGTAAVSHNAGASFRHGVSARDFDEANDHVNDSTGVHGIGSGSSVVGTTDTQTLTNKTISGANNTVSNIAQASVTDLTTDLAAKAPVANPTFTGVASFPDGSASDPSVTNDGDTNTGLFFPAADTVAVTTGGSERLRVDSSGRLLLGRTSANNVSGNAGFEGLQVSGNATSSSVSLTTFANNASASLVTFAKSRSATLGTNTVVNDGDRVGAVLFQGADGTDYETVALIEARVDGAPGDNDMPGRLGFFTTADGTNTSTERMRIDRNGLITGTGTSLGAWTTYTPTLAGAGWDIGDGTIGGWYNQIGKMVFFRAYVVFGSTSTYGNANPSLSLPVTSRQFNTAYARYFPMSATAVDSSLAKSYMLGANSGSNTAIQMRALTTSSAYTTLNSTTPFTWASSDSLIVAGAYEAA